MFGERSSNRPHDGAELIVAACLAGEYLLISVLFDATFLERRFPWLAGVGYVGPLLIAIATAGALFWPSIGIPAESDGDRPDLVRRRSGPRWRGWLAHVSLFGLFLELTHRVTSPRLLPPGPQFVWFSLWVATGAGAALALLVAVAEPRLALRWARGARFVLPVAAAVGAAAWYAGRSAETLWSKLGPLTVAATASLLRLWTGHVESDPARLRIGLPGFRVRVAPVCSGYEGIGLTVVLVTALLFAQRKTLRFPAALLLLPIGVVAAWCANVVRIALLVLVGSRWSPSIAYGGFHSKAGWIVFCGLALGLSVLSRRRPFSATVDEAHPAADAANPAVPYLVPFIAMSAAALVEGLASGALQPLYPVRVIVALLALFALRRFYRGFRVSLSLYPLFLGAAAFAIWLALPAAAASDGEILRLKALGRAGVPWLALRMVGGVLVRPIVEELAFRGFLMRKLIDSNFSAVSLRRFDPKAFVLSSLAFGAVHQAIVAGTLAGMAYGSAQMVRGRTSDAVVAHAATNGLLAACAFLWGRWDVFP